MLMFIKITLRYLNVKCLEKNHSSLTADLNESRCWVIFTYTVLCFPGLLKASASDMISVSDAKSNSNLRLLAQGATVIVPSWRFSQPGVVRGIDALPTPRLNVLTQTSLYLLC